jgi:hypothetical protein
MDGMIGIPTRLSRMGERRPAGLTCVVIGPLAVVLALSQAGAADLDSPYGVTAFVPSPNRWDRIGEAGIGWARCDFSWRMVETAQDVFDWTVTDQEVAGADSRGVRIYAGLGYTPAWASSGGRSQDPPDDPADWYDYVYQCVSRYKGSIKHWELWNEPNLSIFFAGTRSRYINDILKVGADAAHAADPDCMVLAPEISSCCQATTWMGECLQMAGDRIDIISYHQYDGGDTPAGRVSALESMHNYVISIGYGNKPIWVTESGWRSDCCGVTEQIQGDYLVGMLEAMELRSSWWKTYFWYQIWEAEAGEKWGLLYPNETPKPSWYAYRDHIAAHPAPERVSINLSTSDISDDLTRVVVGDGDSIADTQAGRRCRRNVDPNDDYYAYFAVDDAFAHEGSRPEVTVNVDYYDGTPGTITLQYDSATDPYTSTAPVARTGVNTWKQAVFKLTDTWFGNRQNQGADFRVFGGTGNTFYLDVVTVTTAPRLAEPATSPSPPHQSIEVSLDADLSWTAGAGATSHDVYFGTSNPPPFQIHQVATVYDPGTMMEETIYYWRIDEVNTTGTTSGPLWQFTTARFNGDFDGDLDVDLADFGEFQICYTGTGALPEPGCERADLDGNGDVDPVDFVILAGCLSGANIPATPGCAD